MVVALCGIVYELIIGTVSSYLLGNSVYQFSLTIGFFMFAMGVGSYLTRFIGTRLIEAFVYVEMALAVVGGLCSITLFMIFPYAPWFYTTAMFGFIFLIGALGRVGDSASDPGAGRSHGHTPVNRRRHVAGLCRRTDRVGGVSAAVAPLAWG